jgi:hypothetical protein
LGTLLAFLAEKDGWWTNVGHTHTKIVSGLASDIVCPDRRLRKSLV